MSIRILTKNSIENTNIDGARANNFNAGRRSGIVKGVLNEGNFFASNVDTIALETCELRLCGHRVVIDSPQTRQFSNAPSSDTRYSYVAHLSVESDGSVSFSLNTQTVDTSLVQDNLDQNGIGVYELEIGRFTLNTSGHIEDVVRTADLITGGMGQGSEGGINIGTVTTNTLSAGLEAEVDIENRYNPQDNKTYTDFSFSIPRGVAGNDGEDALIAEFILTEQIPPTTGFNINVPINGLSRTPVVGDKLWIVQDPTASSNPDWSTDTNSDPILYYLQITSVTASQSPSYDYVMAVDKIYSRKIKGPKGNTGSTGQTGPQGNDGNSVTWKGAWVSGSNYSVLDMVEYNGSSYICTTAITGSTTNPATDTTHFSLSASKGQDGTILPSTTTAGQLVKSTSTSGTFALGNGLPYLTTAPSADNTDGLIIVKLSSEPATKYNGYIYIITAS